MSYEYICLSDIINVYAINSTHILVHMSVYIYIYICVCVCVYMNIRCLKIITS